MATISKTKDQNDILFNDFFEEKKHLESTLATLELLNDENALTELNLGIEEIKQGKSVELNTNEIDNL